MATMIPHRWLLRATLLSWFLVNAVHSYEATWESLDSRPLPKWYDESKFGIFIHWGVFSVPSYGGEHFWQHWGRDGDAPPTKDSTKKAQDFVRKTELPHFSYADYAQRFDATLYQPEHWAKVFAQSGAQYVVLTSKHHEGFCNWNSRDIPTTWNWNAMDVGPRRDLVRDLAREVKKSISNHTQQRLRFGLYHSLYEWFNPLYAMDKKQNFTTSQFVTLKTMPELYDLVEKYEPEIIWSDGDWGAHSDYWDAKQFLAWYATNSSVAKTGVWNDRWGKDCRCQHGSFLTCADRYLPDKLQKKKWENGLTITKKSWGYDRSLTLDSYQTTEPLIHTMIQTVAYGGNMLLNVGPRADGTLDPIFEERLLDIGEWLNVNAEAIYNTRPWRVSQHEPASKVFYTTKTTEKGVKTLYALFTEWPDSFSLRLAAPEATPQTEIRLLGLGKDEEHSRESTSLLQWESGENITVVLPVLSPRRMPCRHAWALAITNIANFADGPSQMYRE